LPRSSAAISFFNPRQTRGDLVGSVQPDLDRTRPIIAQKRNDEE